MKPCAIVIMLLVLAGGCDRSPAPTTRASDLRYSEALGIYNNERTELERLKKERDQYQESIWPALAILLAGSSVEAEQKALARAGVEHSLGKLDTAKRQTIRAEFATARVKTGEDVAAYREVLRNFDSKIMEQKKRVDSAQARRLHAAR
jgi:hypothetical protein